MTQPFLPAAATWPLMMIGMMPSSVLPFLTTFAVMARRGRTRVHRFVFTASFFLGYCLVLGCFSVIAAGIQVARHTASLLLPMSLSLGRAGGAQF